MPSDWIQIVSIGVNSATLIGLVTVVRRFTQLEFKVELMWKVFVKKFGNLHEIDTDE